jgi:hypothetical protein
VLTKSFHFFPPSPPSETSFIPHTMMTPFSRLALLNLLHPLSPLFLRSAWKSMESLLCNKIFLYDGRSKIYRCWVDIYFPAK